MPTRLDDVLVDDARHFDAPVKMILRDDSAVELYVVDEKGLEEYAGLLEVGSPRDAEQMRVLMTTIQSIVKKKPLSQRSLWWLTALARCGLLRVWEHHV